MKKLRFFAAMFISKLACIGMKMLHRQATYLPGKIAIKLCPDFLAHIKRPETVAAVTGTNGKTTVSNMVTNILTHNGYKVINNVYGSNIDAGIASALINYSSIFGKPKYDLAVLEVDERSSLRIYPYLRPDYIVCTNIMRDSVKRNADTDFITYIISSALPKTTKLILNGDDIICSAIGSTENTKYYFGVEHLFGNERRGDGNTVRDITYCPECGAELSCEYIRYNHIGHVFCPECGFKNHELDFAVKTIDRDNNTLTISQDGKEYSYRLVNDNITNIYNTAAAVSLLTKLGLSYDEISSGLENTKIVSSRFDSEECCGKNVTLQLAKSQNPIACSRAIDYVCKKDDKIKTVIVIVDDIHDNCNNTENMCWIYDCDYSPFADPSVKQVVFGGPRCHDHVLRAMLDGVPREKIVTTDTVFDTVNAADLANCEDISVLYDLYLVSDAKKLSEMLKNKIREENAGYEG